MKGFRDAVHDSAEYYMIGYYLDRSKTKSGWRKLAVKVRRDHIEVRARNGFFVTNATTDPETSRNRFRDLAPVSGRENDPLDPQLSKRFQKGLGANSQCASTPDRVKPQVARYRRRRGDRGR